MSGNLHCFSRTFFFVKRSEISASNLAERMQYVHVPGFNLRYTWYTEIYLSLFCSYFLTICLNLPYSKIQNKSGYHKYLIGRRAQRRWGFGISMGIKEIACGISRGQLKTKWTFQGWPKQNNVEFRGVFVFGLGFSKGFSTSLWNIQGLSFVLSGISRGEV